MDVSPADLADRAPVGLFALSGDGHLLYANRAFRALCGGSLLARVHPDHAPALRAALSARTDVSGRFRLFSPSGATKWVQIHGTWNREPPMVAGVAVDVTELVEEMERLRDARDEAIQAAAMKDEFLASVSHEIRTPTNAVVTLAELLLGTELTNEQRDHLTSMKTAGAHLVGLLNDILDLTRIGTGRLFVEQLDFELHAVLDEVGRMFTAAALERGLRLRIDTDTSLPRQVKGDALRIRQVLMNLVGNAVKFTEYGSVTISASVAAPGSTAVRFEVRDTGPGIAGSMHNAIFEAFVQGDQSTARLKGGSGLGLTICRQLVELMGGQMGLESAPGEGSTFWFVVPFAAATPQVATSVPATPPSRGRVLLAEDNAVNQKVARSLLVRLGYAVDVVGDGVAALEAVRTTAYDCLIVDVCMPELDGYETARRIRAAEAGAGRARMPIVALTASARGADQDRGLAAGMDAYLTKPIDSDHLATVLDRLILGAPVDRRVIDNLRALPGAHGSLFDDIVDVFTSHADEHLDELRAQVEADRWEEAAREAHGLRGMAVDLGAHRLAELCTDLEARCRAEVPPSPSDAAALLHDLRTELTRVSGALAA